MTRTAYNREYYRRTRARRQMLATHRRQRIRWTRWLISSLKWPAEPALIVPIPLPLRRPLLRLPR